MLALEHHVPPKVEIMRRHLQKTGSLERNILLVLYKSLRWLLSNCVLGVGRTYAFVLQYIFLFLWG